MKKNILTAMLLLLSVAAMAQKEIDTSYRWYAQAHINGNWSASEDLRYMKFKDALNWGADVEVGYNFNDFWGVYGQFAWNKNKAATHYNDGAAAKKGYGFTSLEPSINVSYNLTNGLLGYKPGRHNNLYVHLGPSVAIRNKITDFPTPIATVYGDESHPGYYVENNGEDLNKKTSFGGALGLNYVYNFNNWIAFTADITGTIYGDNFSGRQDKDVAVDGRINLGVGLRVYLSKSTKPAREVVYRDEVIVKHDTLRVREERVVNDIDLYPVFFDADKSDVASQQSSVVKQVADKLKANPNKVVYVIGYADETSDTKKNVATLAKNRADAVTNELINKYGIEPERIIEHDQSSATPYTSKASNNRSTICIVTDLKHN